VPLLVHHSVPMAPQPDVQPTSLQRKIPPRGILESKPGSRVNPFVNSAQYPAWRRHHDQTNFGAHELLSALGFEWRSEFCVLHAVARCEGRRRGTADQLRSRCIRRSAIQGVCSGAWPSSVNGRSHFNFRPQLNDPLRGDQEVVRCADCIACHEGVDSLLPTREFGPQRRYRNFPA
jgi:hypothetical protein